MTPTHHPENSLELEMMMKSEEIAEKTHLPEKTQQAAVFCSGVAAVPQQSESESENEHAPML